MRPIAFEIAHASTQRLRLRVRGAVRELDRDGVLARLEGLPGVRAVRWSSPCGLVVAFDGRAPTHGRIVATLAQLGRHPPRRVAATARPAARRGPDIDLLLGAGGALLGLALPAVLRPVAATAGLAAAHALRPRLPAVERTGEWLDLVGLSATALAGHPEAAWLAQALRGAARDLRARLVADGERLLAHVVPGENTRYRVRRDGVEAWFGPGAIQPDDRVALESGSVVPVDGRVESGEGELAAAAHRGGSIAAPIAAGAWLAAGQVVATGEIWLRAARDRRASAAERLRAHLRHAIGARDTAGALAPDLSRLVPLPLAAAGLVLGITGDLGRAAALLQTDPQSGLALAQPLARESVFYAMARHGALCAGLDAVEGLAAADLLAIEDTGILTAGRWRIAAVVPAGAIGHTGARDLVLRALAAVLGHPVGADEPELLVDEAVERLVEHGAVVRGEGGLFHLAGLALARRSHGVSVDAQDAPPLVRHLLLVGPEGAPRALIRLATKWRADLGARLAELRAAGAGRLVLLPRAGDRADAVGPPGFDVVLPAAREAQRAWLEAQAAAGARGAVLHAGLREVVPAGGVSLCPAHGESGADVTLVADPLRGAAAALQLARLLRERMRRAASTTVAVHSGLMALSGLRALPPALVALSHQAWNVYLLLAARRLARAEAPQSIPDDEEHEHGHQGPDPTAPAAAGPGRGGGGRLRRRALRGPPP